MTGARDDDEHSGRQADAREPWHHSTAKVFGASLAGLAAIALIVTGAMFLSRKAGEPPQAPAEFVDPTFSSMTSRPSSSSTPTTTTRISPPLTTDLDLPPELTPTSSPSESETTTSRGRSSTRTEESGENSGESSPQSTTRSRPRLNETRTLYPRP